MRLDLARGHQDSLPSRAGRRTAYPRARAPGQFTLARGRQDNLPSRAGARTIYPRPRPRLAPLRLDPRPRLAPLVWLLVNQLVSC